MREETENKLREEVIAKAQALQDSCWLWAELLTDIGYGRFWRKMDDGWKLFLAHRVMYEEHKGSIPEGYQIDHLCRVRHCINPDHLEAITRKANILRGVSPPALNLKKTHCPSGHEYTEDNILMTKKGRQCRECGRARARYYKAKGRKLLLELKEK